MKFNTLNEAHINHFRTIVASDRFSAGESVLDLHAKDQSSHPPHRPEAVIWPMSPVEVAEILKYANANLIPITGWGSGSSLEGNPIPLKGGLVLDFSRMNRILDIREGDFQADVEPGVVYQDLFDSLVRRFRRNAGGCGWGIRSAKKRAHKPWDMIEKVVDRQVNNRAL